jgi:curved DNA-binding protein CbpA
MQTPDYYAILQIKTDASREEIRAAYKRLAFSVHPDRSDLPLATEETQRLNEAYEVLSNQEKRAKYDRERAAGSGSVTTESFTPDERPSQGDSQSRVKRSRRWGKQIRKLLTLYSFLILLTVVLFLWSLITGRISGLLILLIVGMAVYSVASMLIKIKKAAS